MKFAIALSFLFSISGANAYVDYSKSECRNGSCKCCGDTDKNGQVWWNTVSSNHCKESCKVKKALILETKKATSTK
jgi:hypothetical protein